MVDVSNARPIGILVGYLLTCAVLTARCIHLLWDRSKVSTSHRRNAILVFSALAAVSLATTWYHMFCFFQWSYEQWALSAPVGLDADKLYLGEWLRDTTLFKQAWVSTLERPPRAWWSLQIFGFCAVWSIMLASQSKKGRIPHLWIFMLLGQIVAISFAANLSFLAFTVFDEGSPSESKKSADKPKSASRSSWLPLSWLVILAINLGCAVAIPSNLDHPQFMFLLLAPHVLAFVPLLMNSVFATPAPSLLSKQPPLLAQAATMVILLATAITGVTGEGGAWENVKIALYEHPAVSSVGWDVICCWTSFTAWHILGRT
ncbi:hypothetical protein BHE90_004763 [Fusarium euwallaceae]|uniref:Uncharacterized protein n=1 Tax=Fusarium euwallaceae TaxID=1147111 RepID=A0A430LYF4_9HYPO|nr:hypothetical protein BHE90_004763 [Fusarium euwallaceae]